jgi:glycosyltransferase involved in cell wall biosynthesis
MKNSTSLVISQQNDLNQPQLLSNNQPQPTIALLHCYDLIDDFLDSINISFETFCKEFVGSWMFGYINALKQVNVRTVLFCISARVDKPSRFIHEPTNTKICVLPASKAYHAYRALRRQSLNVYEGSEATSFKNIQDENYLRRSLLTNIKDLVKSLGTYLSTPLGALAHEIKQENCQAILCQEYEYARFDTCVLLGKLLRLPVFASFQGGNRTESLLEVPLRHLSFGLCTGVIIPTQTEIQRVSDRYSIPSSKIAHIFNPLDMATCQEFDRHQARAALGIPLDARVVAWHGRVEIERKGLDTLLEAWQQICCDRPQQDLRLLLVGTGSDAERFGERIKAMELKGVQWLNKFVSDRALIQQYLTAADVYTLPSRQEGFPVAPIEAMSCGLPVVAADAPGIPDILEGGETSGGIIVPRGDASALASELGKVLDNQAWGRKLGHNARDRAESHFSPKAIGKQLCDVFFNQSSQKNR